MFGPSGFWTMAPLRYAAKFDPFLSLDCAPTLNQSKERKGSNFVIWQPCDQGKSGKDTVTVTVKKNPEERNVIRAVFNQVGTLQLNLSSGYFVSISTIIVV